MRLLVGRIGRAHGILGEATIEVRTDDPETRFAIGARVQTDKHGELTIISGRVHNGILLLGFEGISDRNGIEKYKDTLLYSDVDIDADVFLEYLVNCIRNEVISYQTLVFKSMNA